jgi:hypothetical protein
MKFTTIPAAIKNDDGIISTVRAAINKPLIELVNKMRVRISYKSGFIRVEQSFKLEQDAHSKRNSSSNLTFAAVFCGSSAALMPLSSPGHRRTPQVCVCK